MPDSTLFSLDFPHNPEDKRPLPEIIAENHAFRLVYHEIEGIRYYAVQDWIVGVAQVEKPRQFWNDIKRRTQKVGVELSVRCRQLPYRATSGKTYKMDHADAETLYQITQRMDANTGIRDKVLRYLAKAGVIVDEIRIDPEGAAAVLTQNNPEDVLAALAQRYPEAALDAVIRAYVRRGKDEKWIIARLEGKIKCEKFVTALKEAVIEVMRQKDYATATDSLYLGLWKRTAKQLKRELNLRDRDSLRDNQPRLALTYQGIAEDVSAAKLGERAELRLKEACEIIMQVARIIGRQADETAQLLGMDLATGKHLIAGGG